MRVLIVLTGLVVGSWALVVGVGFVAVLGVLDILDRAFG